MRARNDRRTIGRLTERSVAGVVESRTQGFTMVELLVVISIIALLAALLFPVFGIAKDASKRTVCQSNLHQVGLAYSLYAADWDDKSPYAVDRFCRDRPWTLPSIIGSIDDLPDIVNLLSGVAKNRSVFRCPKDSVPYVSGETPPASYSTFYDYNGTSYLFVPHLGTTLSDLSNSHTSYLAADQGLCWHDRCVEGTLVNARINKLFGDMHVAFVK